ncbi:type II toxin-antitoxin system HipA family toxin [Candidatus Obscuribacterales bacterium]|nr:type II toxin-antitoxin system HipA family toxin [Candidatus Obscuribacterales bacterium]
MKKLSVVYVGWGERFVLGTLADDGRDLLFEYTSEAIKRGLELSPHKLPLGEKTYGDFPAHQLRLPGIVSDALPDGWGMLLMDRLFRKQGRRLNDVSPLDRLAFIGDRAMGALVFEPPEKEALTHEDIQLLDLAHETRDVLSADSEDLLRKLVLMGGSPHGARPKVLVSFDRANNRMTNWEVRSGTPMLVKFPAQNEHKEVCAIEVMYARIADACGLEVPPTEYFALDKDLSAFGIERFDRADGLRVPVHTAAGAAHADFRIPQLDYVNLLRLTRRMTGDEREVVRAYERCVFNVVFNNRDDHSKNVSFLLGRDDRWRLSPAYDLSFCEGPSGEHQMDICGEAREPGINQMMELAKQGGITTRCAKEVIERIATVAERFEEFENSLPIRKRTVKQMVAAVNANRNRLV